MNSARSLPFSPSGFYHEDPISGFTTLTHCGDALCARGHWLPPHRHRGFEFLCLARGSIRWSAGGKVFLQRMGDVFVVRPGEWHATASPSKEETHQLWIGLDLDRLGTEGKRLARLLRSRRVRLLSGGPVLESTLRAIVQQIVIPRSRRSAVVRTFIGAFMALIEQAIVEKERPTDVAVFPYSYSVQKVIAYLDRHIDRRVPLAEMAAVATTSQSSHFCARFRREVGETPAAHHLRRRLTEAKTALLQPRAGATRIALQYGFASSQHFSTAFRRFFGVTPRTWQHANQWRNPKVR